MTNEDIKTWATLAGALIAAGASLLNLWWQRGDRNDRFQIHWGLKEDRGEPWTSFYVVNTGKHDIEMVDYGFGYSHREKEHFSLPWDWLDNMDGETRLETFGVIAPRQQPTAGFSNSSSYDVAYAYTTTQRFPRLAFKDSVRWWKRLQLRALVRWHGVKALSTKANPIKFVMP